MVNRPVEKAATVPAAAGRAATWTACGASVRGASHVRDGLPNQDAIALWTSDDAASPLAIVAIADGHGSPRHFRSALGARFAVDESIAVLRELAPRLDGADPGARAHLAAVDLPLAIVEGWTVRTREHLAAHPLTEEEMHGVTATEGPAAAEDVAADPLLAYGATLLAALVTAQCVVLTQLGDGDILAVETDGSTARPLPTDERLTGNLTTSICRAGAEGDFRSIVLPRRATLVALLLSTDGYANSFKSDADFLQVGSDFVAMIGKDGIVAVEKQLDAILEDASSVGSGDDITLGILQCVDSSRSAIGLATSVRTESGAAAGEGATTADPRLAAAESHVQRMRIISALALVVALGAVGWTWRDRLSDWFKPGTPSISSDAPKIDIPKAVKGPKADRPSKPDFGEPAATPTTPAVPKGVGDGGVVAPAAPKIEGAKAKRVEDGVRVTASLVFDGPPDPACRFEATLWNAKDHRLESSASAIVAKASSDRPLASAAPETVKAEATLAFPKDAERTKAIRAKDTRYSTAVTCDGRTVAETAKQPIDG